MHAAPLVPTNGPCWILEKTWRFSIGFSIPFKYDPLGRDEAVCEEYARDLADNSDLFRVGLILMK